MAYSLDLRHRALALLSQGHDVEELSSLPKVGTATLWRWKRREKQGPLAAHSPQKRGFYAVQFGLQRLQVTRKKDPAL